MTKNNNLIPSWCLLSTAFVAPPTPTPASRIPPTVQRCVCLALILWLWYFHLLDLFWHNSAILLTFFALVNYWEFRCGCGTRIVWVLANRKSAVFCFFPPIFPFSLALSIRHGGLGSTNLGTPSDDAHVAAIISANCSLNSNLNAKWIQCGPHAHKRGSENSFSWSFCCSCNIITHTLCAPTAGWILKTSFAIWPDNRTRPTYRPRPTGIRNPVSGYLVSSYIHVEYDFHCNSYLSADIARKMAEIKFVSRLTNVPRVGKTRKVLDDT